MSSTSAPLNQLAIGLDIVSRTKAPGNSAIMGLLEAFAIEMRVALPGIIQSFDPDTQTCTVKPALQDLLRVNDQLQWSDIYPAGSVPVVMPRGGGFVITIPVQVGDECLMVFGDCCIDSWWQSGCSEDPNAAGNYIGQKLLDKFRRHDLSDAFCIPGPWNQKRLISDYATDALEIRSEDGTVNISVSASGITITSPTVNVNCTGTAVVSAENVQVSATSMANLNANQIKLNSDTTIAMTAPDGLTLNGNSYGLHTHFVNPSNVGSTTGNIVPGT